MGDSNENRRAELKKFAQSPFTFKLSAEAAKARKGPREPRQVVFCSGCGSAIVRGNGRNYDKRTVHYCDQDCFGIALAIIVAKDAEQRALRRAEVRAGIRARELTKRRLANVKPCVRCQSPTSRQRYCSDDCCKLSKQGNKKPSKRFA